MRITLKQVRLERGLTQADVARYLNMQTTSYQRIESGTRKGDIELWDALEDLFNLPQRQLRENFGAATPAKEKEPDGNPAENNVTSKE